MAHPEDRPAAIEEALRKHAPAPLMPRFAERATVIGGVEVPAGSMILCSGGAANHDPAIFPEPEAFRLDRGTNRHATFGRGHHFCLGSHLAREELRLSLDLLLGRLAGLRLADDHPIRPAGTVVRGIRSLPVRFDAVLPAPGAA
jgi:cytochrome P450